MALKYKDLKDPEVRNPLTSEELKFIDKVEKYIDEQIKEEWTNNYGINIFLGTAQFKYDPITKMQTKFNDFRREKMFKELEARYKQADWNCKVKIDTEMSMNSCDYWILTPKKQ